MSDELITGDVLVVGCGIAGGVTALELADAGVDVVVVTRAHEPEESNTVWAQGGIIFEGEDDSPSLLGEDIVQAGAGLCFEPAVQLLTERGPDAVRRLLFDRIGVEFDRLEDGSLSLGLEGGHQVNRILHAADATGQAIEIALLRALQSHPNVRLFTGHTAIDLLTPAHNGRNRLQVYEPRTSVGAYIMERATGRVRRFLARKTVLATGGLGQLFLRTTNPAGARGDGIAMAYRTGVRVINAEFVQFHPTAFYRQQAAHFLISEAVRGAGARLVHRDGRPFMQEYDAQWGDLAPRDVVSRSIHTEMLANGVPNVYLDLRSHMSAAVIKEKFPNIYERCLEWGVDATQDLVPVVPAAHYFCGGIRVDLWGRTTRQHLYAVGEVACTGVHGANRLASTSLLEGLVWGERAAQSILRALPETALHDPDDMPPWDYAGDEIADPALIRQDLSSIKHIMWNYVGLARTTERLDRARRDLRNLDSEIEGFYRSTRLTDELLGLRNAVRAAIVVADAAWRNRQSVGCHYRAR